MLALMSPRGKRKENICIDINSMIKKEEKDVYRCIFLFHAPNILQLYIEYQVKLFYYFLSLY